MSRGFGCRVEDGGVPKTGALIEQKTSGKTFYNDISDRGASNSNADLLKAIKKILIVSMKKESRKKRSMTAFMP